ncbi:MAG: PAAR-like domain-containing protein [Polyangiaceae bacterium]
MGSVTALMMDVITEKSGHQMVGMAVSVCITPAAPSPLPIPYPTFASVGEGVIDECLRTKIDGAKVLTVGSCTKNCHGNEPGTLKEVVSLNTTGPCFPILGAPIVFIELGMAGITLSPGFMNKNPIPGIGGSASGAGGGGGGGGGAGGGAGGPPGGSTQGPSNGGGGGGGSNSGAAPPNAPAPPGADGQATAGHPVDVITGALFTSPEIDFWLTGFLSFQLTRSYSTSAVRHRSGMGWGWSHSLDYAAERSGDRLEVKLPGARVYTTTMPRGDEIVALPFGAKLSAVGPDLLVEGSDGLFRTLRSDNLRDYRLVEVRDLFGNFVEVLWDEGRIAEINDPQGRRAVWHVQGNTSFWEIVVSDETGKEHRRRAATYQMDSRGDLVRVIDAGGAETQYAYDDEHYLIRETLADGLTYHFVHDGSGGTKRCTETWGEMPGRDILADIGATGTFQPWVRGIYHVRIQYGESRTTVVENALGERHTYQGNARGLVEVYTDPRGYRCAYTYDQTGNLLSVRDGAGHVRRRTYDGAGRRRTDALFDGNTWRTSFDDETQTLSLVRPDGERHEFSLQPRRPRRAQGGRWPGGLHRLGRQGPAHRICLGQRHIPQDRERRPRQPHQDHHPHRRHV